LAASGPGSGLGPNCTWRCGGGGVGMRSSLARSARRHRIQFRFLLPCLPLHAKRNPLNHRTEVGCRKGSRAALDDALASNRRPQKYPVLLCLIQRSRSGMAARLETDASYWADAASGFGALGFEVLAWGSGSRADSNIRFWRPQHPGASGPSRNMPGPRVLLGVAGPVRDS
jgi:hypothetical protein